MRTGSTNPAQTILAIAATICLAALLAVATTRHEQRTDTAATAYAVAASTEPITSR